MPQKASDSFTTWLDQQLQSLKPGSRLPSDKQLAKSFHLSDRTVKNILNQYQTKGSVVRVWGKGTFLSGYEAAQPISTPEPAKTSIQSIVDGISQEIQSGELKLGDALPPVKVMSRRFKASPTTITKAYQELQRLGKATKVGRTFWLGHIAELTKPREKREVFLFVQDKIGFVDIFQTDALSLSYQKMESELANQGYMLRCHKTAQLAILSRQWNTGKLPHALIIARIDKKIYQLVSPMLHAMVDQAKGQPLPFLLDWWSGYQKKRLPKGAMLLSRSNIRTTTARVLAHHVQVKQYRAVYLFENESSKGNPRNQWRFTDMARVRPEILACSRDVHLGFVIRPSDPATTQKEYLQSEGKHFQRRILDRLLSKYEPTTLQKIENEILVAPHWDQVFPQCFPDKEQGPCLWVFSHDTDAAQALEWAQQQRIPVPSKLSVISFDNNPSFYHLGISRCEPDWEAIGYMMAHALIGDFPVAKTTKGFMRTRARFVEKMTTP